MEFDQAPLEVQSPIGAYLILLLPFDKQGALGLEEETRVRISEVIGLLTAVNGRNMAFEHIFDYEYVLGKTPDGKIERRVIGSVLQNPFVLPVPDINKNRLSFISQIDTAIAAKSPTEAYRIALSLRWYQAAIYEDGVDAFLKLWIAIETLAMPDTTNIRPIKEALAKIYRINIEDVEPRFLIGRIFDLRGKIIHQGKQLRFRLGLLEYLQAIYEDLLFDAVNEISENRLAGVISSAYFPGVSEILKY
ncbi:MAG: hypothetical protein HYU84_13880 [Chloroflexi bacterium]|nr:hypothetical protein [Chloroflexota bacterium]MBI3169498.1 hypothetical protein [Chloroflexota bacterium]